jgi:predicted protein tyrosine phosphatase
MQQYTNGFVLMNMNSQKHRNGIQDFFRQQERDRVKNELHKKNDIVLINIPSRYTYMDLKKLKEFIIEELENNGIIVL